VANQAREAWGAFYNPPPPQGNLPVGGVRNLDISRLGPDMSGSGALTRDKGERPDMFEKTLRNPVSKPSKSGWDLVTEDFGLTGHVRCKSGTCPAKVTRTWIRAVKLRIR
jgi:hypothetical protein